METNTIEVAKFDGGVKTIIEPHAVPHGQLDHDVKAKGALTNNATNLALSGQPYDIKAAVERIAKGKLKAQGLITEKFNLNADKLVRSVVADYRAHHAGLYGNRDRIPVYDQIEEAVGEFIRTKLASVLTPANTLLVKRSFVYRKPKLGEDVDNDVWLEKVEAIGENRISLKAQKFACNCEIGRIQRRIKDLLAKPNPDHDLEKRYNEKLLRQERELTYIEGELKRQKTVGVNPNS